MYRNVSYVIDRDRDWQGYIHLDTWDKNGERISMEFAHQCYLYHEDPSGSDRSIYGEPVRQRFFKNTKQRKNWIENNPNAKIYECLPPVTEFLQNCFHGKNTSSNFRKYPLRICYLDIEIAVQDSFPFPDLAQFPINLITFYDTLTKKLYTYALGYARIDRPDIVFNMFRTEKDLLESFMADMKDMRFDILTGWNSVPFDMQYIYNRCVKLLGQEIADSWSPVGGYVRKTQIKLFCEHLHYDKIQIPGLAQIDYQMLYKRILIPVDGRKSSYSLDFIANEELGYGKLKHESDLKHLYRNNFQKFVEYNIRDVELIVEIEAKRKLFDLTRNLCNIALIDYEQILVSSAPVVGSIIQKSRELNVKIPYMKHEVNVDRNDEETFEGGFVRDINLASFRKGITVFDIQSLYPNVMIAFNISSETYMGRIYDVPGALPYMLTRDGRTVGLTDELVSKMKKSDKYCIAANGSVYTTSKEGIIPYFLRKFFIDRLKYKNDAKKVKRQINKMRKNGNFDKSELDALLVKYDELDTEQMTRKIILNTTYGVCGSKYNMFYNINNAEAVTLTGQEIIKAAGLYIDDYVRDNYCPSGYAKPSGYKAVPYGDTDSLMVDIEPLTNNKYGGRFDDVEGMLKDIDAMSDSLNKWASTTLSYDMFNMYVKNRIDFSRENLCDVAYMFKKKHYMLHIIEEDGERVDKIKYKGISIVKSTYPKYMKTVMKNLYERSIKENWKESDFLRFIDDLYNEFQTRDINDISTYIKISSYKESNEFLEAKKGTTGHGKAALYYNHIIDHLKLNGKYDYITSENMRECYVLPYNDFKIDIIGFRDEIPEEFRSIFKVDYKKMFTHLFLKPLETLCDCNGWKHWNGFVQYNGNISIEDL